MSSCARLPSASRRGRSTEGFGSGGRQSPRVSGLRGRSPDRQPHPTPASDRRTDATYGAGSSRAEERTPARSNSGRGDVRRGVCARPEVVGRTLFGSERCCGRLGCVLDCHRCSRRDVARHALRLPRRERCVVNGQRWRRVRPSRADTQTGARAATKEHHARLGLPVSATAARHSPRAARTRSATSVVGTAAASRLNRAPS